ncbi:MAG: haloacid dehalogenase-like hydrolase [Candidatus Altiarchaeota archaeon]|nr:haloacid dehalogenase-like hydrolase [Candidatus Altiarchaeota archaeon]
MKKSVLWKKIRDIEYIVFDFDGSIYPCILLLDLALDFFYSYSGEKGEFMAEKRSRLLSLIGEKNKKSFYELSLEFASVLEGIPCVEFNKKIPVFLQNCYPNALKFINALKKRGKKCFLVSLTSEAVSREAMQMFGFDGYWCRTLRKTIKEGVEFFDGNYVDNINDLTEFKARCLDEFKIRDEVFGMVGNDVEDVLLFESAYLKVGVNPTKELMDEVDLDFVLVDRKDPWSKCIDF